MEISDDVEKGREGVQGREPSRSKVGSNLRFQFKLLTTERVVKKQFQTNTISRAKRDESVT